MVRVFAWAVGPIWNRSTFAHQVFAKNHVGFQCFVGIGQNGEFFILHFDQLDCIGCNITVLCHNKCHFLTLEEHLAVSQNHLFVASQRRHPVKTKGARSSAVSTAITPSSANAASALIDTILAWA